MFSSSSSSSSYSCSKFTLFSPSQHPNSSKFHLFTPLKTPHSTTSNNHTLIPVHSHDSSSSSPVLQEKHQNSSSQANSSEIDSRECLDEEIANAKKSLEELLVVRWPVMKFGEENALDENEVSDKVKGIMPSSCLDERLSRLAKKVPIFEPKVVESGSGVKPLSVNLDLALFKAKILVRNYRYEEAEEILRKERVVYAVVFSHISRRDLVNMAKNRHSNSEHGKEEALEPGDYQAGRNPAGWSSGAEERVKIIIRVGFAQLSDKISYLKKYRNNKRKENEGKGRTFTSQHEQEAYDLSEKMCGAEKENMVEKANGSGAEEENGVGKANGSGAEKENGVEKANRSGVDTNNIKDSVASERRIVRMRERLLSDLGNVPAVGDLMLKEGEMGVKEDEEALKKLESEETEMYVRHFEVKTHQAKLLLQMMKSWGH
ncbi:rRNA 2'-O-methyltransferase fibrillarin [Striga asiatica]|uniref:rRNA 2'-O-methyltransferase fibrillarin n=1 Tax=Striga asiatica TaxID=4170 RepID=A0A5A7PFZ6_STRAF|nr:rRNA 2'-O-methyltransferase fibrillarin [Striga asiatica]